MNRWRGRRSRWRWVGYEALGLLWAIVVLAAEPSGREVWIAIRPDGRKGTGMAADPFDASSPEKLHRLFDRFRSDFGDGLVMHFGPGVFTGDHLVEVTQNDWKIRGAGRELTIFQTRPGDDRSEAFGFHSLHPVSGFEISDLTIDLNAQHLRKANRVFLADAAPPRLLVGYVRVDQVPGWSPTVAYARGAVVAHEGCQYLAREAVAGQAPGPDTAWRALHSCQCDELPPWDDRRAYRLGEAANRDGRGYLRVGPAGRSDPRSDRDSWQPMRTDVPDPTILTHAVFIGGKGHHRVQRVRVRNGNGGAFTHEGFLIGLGGDDSVIEDCEVTEFRGDYCSCIVIFCGRGSRVRRCRVDDGERASGSGNAYGGWELTDAVFEQNVSSGFFAGFNLDSLVNRNLTLRHNRHLQCRDAGIVINVDGQPNPAVSPPQTNALDGLVVCDNIVELGATARFGGIQVQQNGLRNVVISRNTVRTVLGARPGRRAIGVWGNVQNVVLAENTCATGMTAEIFGSNVVCRGNRSFRGQPVPGLADTPAPDRSARER